MKPARLLVCRFDRLSLQGFIATIFFACMKGSMTRILRGDSYLLLPAIVDKQNGRRTQTRLQVLFCMMKNFISGNACLNAFMIHLASHGVLEVLRFNRLGPVALSAHVDNCKNARAMPTLWEVFPTLSDG